MSGTRNDVVRNDSVTEAIHGCLRAALDSGLTEGRITLQDGDRWVCFVWEQVTPMWAASAIADGPTADHARALAELRLAQEVERQKAEGEA